MRVVFVVFLIVLFNILNVSGHAYFSFPVPRIPYCFNTSCQNLGGSAPLGAQGPIGNLPTGAVLATYSPTTLQTCNISHSGAAGFLAFANLGLTYDPGFTAVSATWVAGSTAWISIFVSEAHSPENQTLYPTDGFQILFRDGTNSASLFTPLNLTVYFGGNVIQSGFGPLATIAWFTGQSINVSITVPSVATTDGVFQFYWRNELVASGVLFLSCADIAITVPAVSSSGSVAVPAVSSSSTGVAVVPAVSSSTWSSTAGTNNLGSSSSSSPTPAQGNGNGVPSSSATNGALSNISFSIVNVIVAIMIATSLAVMNL